MKLIYKVLFLVLIASNWFNAYGQTGTDAPALIKEGIQLNNEKKYAEAIEKYKMALAQQPDNLQANYQMAFTLFSSGKNAESLPYIDKATKGNNPQFTAAAYSLMGSIYQGTNQLQKAVAAYQSAIKADNTNQRIYYNLGITYFKGKLYTEAENNFEAAIKRDSSDAGSWRMYALSTFHQNKRAQALLSFCSFLTLQPNAAKSSEAFSNLQNILQQGVLKTEPGYKPSIITKGLANHQNPILKKALSATATRRYATPGDLLSAQLKAVFDGLGSMQSDKYYSWYALANYFGKLAATDNMPTFARYISQSAKPESAKWLKDNAEKVVALEDWLKVSSAGAIIK